MPEPTPLLPHVTRIEPEDKGQFKDLQPAPFLVRWNTIFVAVGLLWVFVVAASALVYYLWHLPPQPSVAGMSAAQAKETLDTYTQVYNQYRQSFTDVFELLVTRTVLPIVTLLLGYLFGRQAAS
ncbi:hypothetical protein [Terriglobus sp.]|uniref:hypothetical protein n=1 Tax=Terriglobus sp. TaxID=1889013 RepID=UPI003B009142